MANAEKDAEKEKFEARCIHINRNELRTHDLQYFGPSSVARVAFVLFLIS